jgi:hypothetical protein
VLGNGGIESLVVRDIEGDGLGERDARRELLGTLKSTASYKS